MRFEILQRQTAVGESIVSTKCSNDSRRFHFCRYTSPVEEMRPLTPRPLADGVSTDDQDDAEGWPDAADKTLDNR